MTNRTLLRLLMALLLLALYLPGYAQPTLLQNAPGRRLLSLNGSWNYILDPYETGFYDYRRMAFDQSPSGKGGYYDNQKPSSPKEPELIEYDFDKSAVMQIPGDWNSQDPKLLYYEGTIWFKKSFSLKPQAGKRYFLYFGAVNYEAHVYLNGKKLGMHRGGFTPIQFDITDRLSTTGDNFVIVKADNTRHAEAVPTINTDWWNYGGITRDVYIAETPATYIADYQVQLAKNDPGKLAGYVQLSGEGKGGQAVTLNIAEAGIRQTLKTDANGRATFSLPAKKLQLWSPQSPRLYAVRLSSGPDAVQDRIGFRTIQTRGQDILLNGKPIFMRGISIHDENPLIPGRTRGEGDQRMLLTWAKELGCNYVRLAHYPHPETMMRLADEMGLLVWAEVPVYWTIAWENPATYQNAEAQLSDLVNMGKNRASIVVWSVGNETPPGDARLKFMTSLVRKARALDDTRLVSAALELHRDGPNVLVDDALGAELDLTSFNEYAGWYWGDKLSDLLNYKFTIKYNKPVVISEFGGDALAGYHGDADTRWSEEYQEALYQNQLKMLSGISGLRGMTPWILTDFRATRRQHPVYQNGFNRKGLISSTGQKKKAFFVLQDYYRQMAQKYEHR
ncbi:glycoside hydrolase family 2 TIM barrel-domain containing protein [Hymenobacter sp. BT770]|uniref:glycoside hydrolase family 2 protein n=1 Tax=Hymenobacter sp. BT770 TaxID=2886942 RepID=UPI001D114B88|nr:glycoside hydrolase family 2 TIM barrel-domain containing protein [Hymenobacter sp. BT770]MCC3153220.1 beta-glucuronidase [Hymenobacter sp. BT770]MDO3414215.1 glycoside hydrolase family 2 TIM barrel-domain containing protein [Hymenobacter sp. BT770]